MRRVLIIILFCIKALSEIAGAQYPVGTRDYTDGSKQTHFVVLSNISALADIELLVQTPMLSTPRAGICVEDKSVRPPLMPFSTGSKNKVGQYEFFRSASPNPVMACWWRVPLR